MNDVDLALNIVGFILVSCGIVLAIYGVSKYFDWFARD